MVPQAFSLHLYIFLHEMESLVLWLLWLPQQFALHDFLKEEIIITHTAQMQKQVVFNV